MFLSVKSESFKVDGKLRYQFFEDDGSIAGGNAISLVNLTPDNLPTVNFMNHTGTISVNLPNGVNSAIVKISPAKPGPYTESVWFDNILITKEESMPIVSYFAPNVVSSTEYWPFGYPMKATNPQEYRFGFNGKEKDEEGMGGGATYDYGFRIYNPQIARFLSVDPLTKSYPWYTPYQFAGNKPIWAVDLDGLEEYYATDGTYIGNVGGNTEVRIINDSYLEMAETAIWKANSHDESTEYGYTKSLLNQSTSLMDYAEGVKDVLNNAELEEYVEHHDCYAAALAQMREAGVETTQEAIYTEVDNSQQTNTVNSSGQTVQRENLEENSIGGAIYLMTQLKKRNPIIVGVSLNYEDGTKVSDVGNWNALSTHFIVVTSMKVEDGNISFGYYDNGNSFFGKSPDNQMNFDTNTGEMKDDSYNCVGGTNCATVSEVRKNKDE